MQILMTALQPGGGIRTFFRYVYSQPCFRDCHIYLVAPDRGLTEYLLKYLPEGRLTVLNADSQPIKFTRQIRKIIGSGEFDLIHSHGFTAGALTEIARMGKSLPHIMTAHDVFRPEQFSGLAGKLKKILLGFLFCRIDKIHTVTPSASENFCHYMPLVPRGRVKTILHGIDTDFFKCAKGYDLKKELKIPSDAPLIGFFGRFMAQKGFRTLVDAMALLAGQLECRKMPRVATFGWGGFIREDYQYLKENGMSDFFFQLPATDQMPDTLKSVDLVAMPSLWEACGLLAMEALSAGVPIVGTDCVGLKDVLEGTPARIIPSSSPEALANAIKEMFCEYNPDKFIEYQDIACERFSVSHTANSIRLLYSEMKSCGVVD